MPTVEFIGRPTPGLESGVLILELLAESLYATFSQNYKPMAVDCGRRDLGLADIPRILGGFACQRLPTVGDDSKSLARDREKALKWIWEDFFKENRIRKLPRRTLDLLERAAAETRKKLKSDPFDFSWMEQAHLEAHRFIDRFLKTRSLGTLSSLPPMKVKVVEDLTAQMFCARTQRERGEIQWAHQNVSHALQAMILAERVLAHEYLSHVVPRNATLGRPVSEQWLVALLQDLYEKKDGEPHWPAIAFPVLRRDLEDQVARVENAKYPAAKAVGSMGILGVETAGSDLLEHAPSVYWRFTEQLLTLPAEEEVEAILTDLMGYLAVAGPEEVERALSRNYKDMRDLHRWLGLGIG
jgi:hypothetical protein